MQAQVQPENRLGGKESKSESAESQAPKATPPGKGRKRPDEPRGPSTTGGDQTQWAEKPSGGDLRPSREEPLSQQTDKRRRTELRNKWERE